MQIWSNNVFLRPVLLIGGSDKQGQQIAQRINGSMHFVPFAMLGSIVTCMTPLSGVDCKFSSLGWLLTVLTL